MTTRFMFRLLPGAFIGCLSFIGCQYTCQEFQRDFREEFDEIRRTCECDFTVECDDSMTDLSLGGVTVRAPDGRILIRLPGGEREMPKSVLRHELVHAIDYCRRFSETQFPTPASLIGTRGETIFEVRRALLAEFIAYRCAETWIDEDTNEQAFPDPDDDDRAIFSAYHSIQGATSRLPREIRNALIETLEAASLAPAQLRPDSPLYQEMKREFIRLTEQFKNQARDCLELILDF